MSSGERVRTGDPKTDGQGQSDAQPKPRLWKATDLQRSRQPGWLAFKRIQRAAVNLLVGDEGIGKSLFWVWIVAAITTGKLRPGFGIPERHPEHVTVVCTEDDWCTTVRPRLEVAGADLKMITVFCTSKDGSGPPVFPRDLPELYNANPMPSLIVLDAWLSTISSGLKVRDPQDARLALDPWTQLATRTKAAVMPLTHTNRAASANPRDKYGITAELRKVARLTLFAQIGTESGLLVVGPEKANNTRVVTASRFRVEQVQKFAPTIEDDGEVARLVFDSQSAQTVGQHLADEFASQRDVSGSDTAVMWLSVFLASGPRWVSDIREAIGQTDDLTFAKVESAKRRMKVGSGYDGHVGAWFWRLPQDKDRTPEHPPTGQDGARQP